MSNTKLSLEAIERLEKWCKTVGHIEYFNEIKNSGTCQLRQRGEFMYLLLKLGYSPIEIDQLLDIRVSTIERRILNELKIADEEQDTYETYAFLFENVTGLPWLDIYRIYMRSNLSESAFILREGIDREIFNKIKESFSTKGAIRYEKEIRLKRQEICENRGSKVKNRIGVGKRIKKGVAQFYKLA